jgi:hypothetical protein
VRGLGGALVLALLAAACTSAEGNPTTTTSSLAGGTLEPIDTDRLLVELELESLARITSNLRGLDFVEPVQVQILDDDDYRRRVDELVAAPLDIDPDQAASWLQLLGALPAETNEYAARGRMLQTTAAFFDPEASAVLVRAGAGIDPYVESAIVHEMVHALQIQNFGRPGTRLLDGDRGYVYEAITEGDAQRITNRFIDSFGSDEEFGYEEGLVVAAEDATVIRAATPPFVLDGLRQPAEDGVRFLRGRGNEEVDLFFSDLANMAGLPPSSEAILLPGGDLDPQPVRVRQATVPPYEPLPTEGTLGVGRLRLLLQRVVDADLLEAALVGWGGDHLDVRVHGDHVIFAYAFRGEQPEDAQELAAAFRLLLDTRLAGGAYGSVRVSDDTALVLAASDPGVKEHLDELFDDYGEEVFFVELGR